MPDSHRLERHRLIAVLDQAPFPLAMVEGPDHRFVFANESYINLFFKGQEVIGRSVRDLVPDVEAQGYNELLDRVAQTGTSFHGKEKAFRVRQADGSYSDFILDFVYQPMRGKDGKIEGILCIAIDVTQQVRARNAIKNQQLWLESILNRMPTGLVMVSPKENKVTFTNEAAQRMLAIPLVGTMPDERYAGQVKAFDQSGRLLGVDEIPSARAARGEEMKEEKFTLETPAGVFQVAAASEMIPASHGHEPTSILLLQDISALLQSEARFRIMADSMPQIVWTAREDGVLNYVNQRWSEYSGSSDPEKWLSFVHPEDVDEVTRVWLESVTTGAPYQAEFRLRRKTDGEYRWHLVRALASSKEKLAPGTRWFGTCTDVTDQKQLQSEIQEAKTLAEVASATKSAFLANMSHEIRTPLGAILGFTELLKTSPLSADARDFLEIIDRNGQALTRIIDDILDLSKVEAGQMAIELLEFSLPDLVRDVVSLFADKARTKGLTLRVQDTGAPVLVISDSIRIRQILINLIGNAVKFTTTGVIEVSLISRPVADMRVALSIQIRDTGPGLSDEQRGKLFQPFVQADESTSRRFGGTGLGLALSRRLARALGGDVKILESHPGRGSVFAVELEVTLPIPSSVPLVAPAATPALPLRIKRLESVRVLAVDDAPDNRMLMSILLRREGAEVHEAGGGAEAIKKAFENDFDVVLMDIQMPDMDGYEALTALRKQGYKKPILALTAHAMTEERRRTKEAGFGDHIVKPIDREALVGAILKHASVRV